MSEKIKDILAGAFTLLALVAGAFILLALVAALVIFASAQTSTPADPFEGADSHSIPHCSPRGGLASAPCECLGMVSHVQRNASAECWAKEGFKNPETISEELRIIAPESVLKCLGEVMDHCEIIARTPYQLGYEGKQTCRTSCRPDRCGCADGPCKAHGEPGVTY